VRPKLPLLLLVAAAACAPPPTGPGTLLLSNPNFGPTYVQAVITANADCGSHGPGYVSTLEFVLPNNATRFVNVPPGTEVCWRHSVSSDQSVAGQWSSWDRAYVAPGSTIGANL
jgi:hypothetical protein